MWNRRSFPRWLVDCEVMCGDGNNMTRADACEISEIGIAFHTAHDYPVGSEIDVRYRFAPTEDWVDVKVEVRHRLGTKIGAQFLNLPLKERVRFWGRNLPTHRTNT